MKIGIYKLIKYSLLNNDGILYTRTVKYSEELRKKKALNKTQKII